MFALHFTSSLHFLSYTICLAAADSISLLNNTTEGIVSPDIKTNVQFYHNNFDDLNASIFDDNSTVSIVPWDRFLSVLIKESTKVLENIRKNIKQNYYLDYNLIRLIDELFNDIGEYEVVLQSNLKMILDNDQYNDTKEFMLDFMDMSNLLIEKMVEFNLDKVHLITPTKWYETLKDKIQRQEMKAAASYVENKICQIGVCKEMKFYSDYLKNWLRCLLNLKSFALKEFFRAVPDSLEKHKHAVKSNIKFRQTIKTILNLDVAAQRDTLDFVDEVLIARERIFGVIPESIKKAAALLMELFKMIDVNYDINKENVKVLTQITDTFYKLLENKYVNIPLLLDLIVDNMKINLKIWPLKMQNKIYNLWSHIIKL